MGLFNRGQSISGMWLDGKPAIRAYLGDVLVWDGTSPAFVNVPRALVSALAVAPAVRADASITAVRAMGSSSVIAPSLTAFATVDPETAVIVTAQASAPVVRADSIIMVETITVGAQALPAVAAQSSSAAVEVPSIPVFVSVPTPTVAAHFATTIPAIAVNASAQVPVITATGAAAVNVPVSAVNVTARVPVVSGNSSVVAFAVTADAVAKTPVVTASSSISPPAATATGLARVPVVQAINFTAMGVILPTANSWTSTSPRKSLGWSADSAFPGTVVSSDGIQVNGSKIATVAFDLTYRWAWTGSVNVAAYVAGVQRGSTVSWTNPNANADYNKTGEITVTVVAGETVDLYVWTSHSFAFTMRNTSKWSIT